MSRKVIFHVRLDRLFVALEGLRHPHLRGKPVAVSAANGRGAVISVSAEASRLGVQAGMSVRDALLLCPGLVLIPPDMPRYLDASRRILALLSEITEQVEPVAIDEVFLDVTRAVQRIGDVEALAAAVKQRVLESEGLSVSIGAGPNRMVARVANELQRPDGFTYISADRVADEFRDLPLSKLEGVGKATQSVLESFGIHTVGQLATFPREPLRRRFGKWGEELIRIANGQGSEDVESRAEGPADKVIGHEYTFSRDLTDPAAVIERLRLIADRVGRRLRASGYAAGLISLKLRYHELDSFSHSRKLKRQVLNEADIYAVAQNLFREVYEAARSVRLVGIYVSQLVPLSQIAQQELFESDTEPSSLGRIRDEIQERFGEQTINYADTFTPQKRSSRPRYPRGSLGDPLLGYTPSRPAHSGADEKKLPPAGSDR